MLTGATNVIAVEKSDDTWLARESEERTAQVVKE